PSSARLQDFLSDVVRGGERVVDYGAGSGVLSIAAIKLGAATATAVDIDLQILDNCHVNCQINGVTDRVEVVHGRELLPGRLRGDVVVANILVGPLLRLLPVLVLALPERGWLALSGFRRADAPVLREAFGRYVDWDDSLEATATHPTWGEWVRLVGRPKVAVAGGGG
ncbi:unnamed protein product, partial [Phaeothamnion confervicola]